MRIIKFRAWNKIMRNMYHWDLTIGFQGTGKVFSNVEQFTGLQDKNGVDIYEGDLMDCPVDGVFQEMVVVFSVDRDLNGWNITPQDIENGAVVIGNINQNTPTK